MYAVVKTGGKQYRVEEGQTLEVDRAGEPGAELTLPAVLVVDGDTVLATSHRRRCQGPEDQRVRLQEQVEQPEALGPSRSVEHHRDHRHHEGLINHVEDQGWRLHQKRA